MVETIRERIIQAVIAKLAEATVARGYQYDIGANVRRVDSRLSEDDLPACNVWPQQEQVRQEYGLNVCEMEIKVEALALIGDGNASQISERLLGDLIEALTATKYSLQFTSGGPYVPVVGDEIEGASSGATGYIEQIALDSGSWAAGDAAGTMTLRRAGGLFVAGEALEAGTDPDVATVAASPTGQGPTATTTAGLAERIAYVQGGPGAYPDAADVVAGTVAAFSIVYRTQAGNPYEKG